MQIGDVRLPDGAYNNITKYLKFKLPSEEEKDIDSVKSWFSRQRSKVDKQEAFLPVQLEQLKRVDCSVLLKNMLKN